MDLKKILFVFLFTIPLFAQNPLVRRDNLGDTTAVLRALIGTNTNAYDLDSANAKNLITDTATVLRNEISSNASERVDGWYYDNVTASVTAQFMGRGFGRMGSAYRISRDCYLSRMVFTTSPDAIPTAGSIAVRMYINGSMTDYVDTISTTHPYGQMVDYPSQEINFNELDYIEFAITSSSDLTPLTIDVNLSVEFNHFDDIYAAGSGGGEQARIYAIAVDSGTVRMEDVDKNHLSNPCYVNVEDSVLLIGSKTYSGSSYNFTTWTGCEVVDDGYKSGTTWIPSQRYNDSVWVIVNEDMLVRGRFQKTLGDKVLFASNNADSASSMITSFYNGHDNTGADAWNGSEIQIASTDWKTIFQYADTQGCDVIVTNIYDPEGAKELAQKYYPVQLIMPSGGYGVAKSQQYDTNGDLPSIILVGMTDTACYNRSWITGDTYEACYSENAYNLIGYDAEYTTLNHNASVEPEGGSILSTVAYFAGLYLGNIHKNFDEFQSVGVIGTLIPFRDYYGARYLFRYDTDDMSVERSWTATNGYGYVDQTYIGEAGYYTYIFNNAKNNPYLFRELDPYLKR